MEREMDDGDVRPAVPRPWGRLLLFGLACAMLGAALVFAYFLWRTSSIEVPPSHGPWGWERR